MLERTVFMEIDKVHTQVLHKFQALHGQVLVGRDPIKGSQSSPKVKPDQYVSEEHILHDLVRGFYKPGGKKYLLSYLATESVNNYGKQIDWKDEKTFTFNTIIMHPPSAEKDVRKKSDIEAARNNMMYGIPIGILFRVKDRHNAILGLGQIVEERTNGDFVIVPYKFNVVKGVDDMEKFDKVSDLVAHIHTYIISRGFYYSKDDLYNFYLSLRSKPFVIVSGISGTGKTKIVELFANSVGATEDNGQFKMIPVRPDWSDSSDLLGYLTLQEEYKKGPLAEIIEHAMNYPDLPHFALLDEMNLARVEYYFSDVLSVMESRKKGLDGKVVSSNLVDPILYQKEALGKSVGGPLRLTNNLYIIGTVNMDETTHPFSKKILDRANTIEFNQIKLSHFDLLKGITEKEPARLISNDNLEASYIHLIDVFNKHQEMVEEISKDIEAINESLSKINAQVGYRVRDEICFYMVHNKESNLLSENEAMDFCYMQKILPRISGGGQVVEDLLMSLEALWTVRTEEGKTIPYPRSYAKVKEMLGRLEVNGFTSFWIA